MDSNEGTGRDRDYERGAFNNRIGNLRQAQKIALKPKVLFATCRIEKKMSELFFMSRFPGK